MTENRIESQRKKVLISFVVFSKFYCDFKPFKIYLLLISAQIRHCTIQLPREVEVLADIYRRADVLPRAIVRNTFASLCIFLRKYLVTEHLRANNVFLRLDLDRIKTDHSGLFELIERKTRSPITGILENEI